MSIIEDDPEFDPFWYPDIVPVPKGMKWKVKYETTGPREDPYGVTKYIIRLDGTKIEFIDDSFAGVSLIYNDSVIIESSAAEHAKLAYLWFEAITGVKIRDVEMWNNLYNDYGDIRDAEIAAGWDSSP